MNTRIVSPLRSMACLPLAAMIALTLSACGGGGGGSSGAAAIPAVKTAQTTLKGAVIDGPIVGANIIITTDAPLNQSGATQVGTATSTAGGSYVVSITLPAGTAPVFTNATATTAAGASIVLSAYLGPENTVAASSTLTSTNIPNLVISQVTTAALAIYQKLSGGSYAGLTPGVYAALLSQHHDDILPLAAAIQAITDNLCTAPSGFKDTEAMADDIANNATLAGGTTTSTVTTTASQTFQASCDTELQNLTQSIASNSNWSPELDQGDINQIGISVVAPGTYTLQGLITQTGINASTPSVSPTAAVMPTPFNDLTVNVDPTGVVTSTDTAVSGTILGNYLLLNITDVNHIAYTFAGKLGVMPANFLAAGAGVGYAIRTGGQTTDANQTLSRFDAVLVPASALPNWTGIAQNGASQEDGLSCPAGSFGARLMGSGSVVGGVVLGTCITPQPTGLQVVQSTTRSESESEYNSSSMVSTTPIFNPITLASATTGVPMPFILVGTATMPGNSAASLTGTIYYVMGANEVIFAELSPALNGFFSMNENPLDKLQQTSSGSDH